MKTSLLGLILLVSVWSTAQADTDYKFCTDFVKKALGDTWNGFDIKADGHPSLPMNTKLIPLKTADGKPYLEATLQVPKQHMDFVPDVGPTKLRFFMDDSSRVTTIQAIYETVQGSMRVFAAKGYEGKTVNFLIQGDRCYPQRTTNLEIRPGLVADEDLNKWYRSETSEFDMERCRQLNEFYKKNPEMQSCRDFEDNYISIQAKDMPEKPLPRDKYKSLANLCMSQSKSQDLLNLLRSKDESNISLTSKIKDRSSKALNWALEELGIVKYDYEGWAAQITAYGAQEQETCLKPEAAKPLQDYINRFPNSSLFFRENGNTASPTTK